MQKQQQKVLVTGGGGFIGSHVVRALVAQKIAVTVFDSFISSSRGNIPDGVEVIEGDIRDRTALQAAMKGVSHVVHLAALVSVPESVKNPAETHDVNVTGFVNVLEAARIQNIQRIVYASSAAVYGDESTLPKTESMETFPQSPYALSKRENELQAKLYFDLYKQSSIGLRFFNVYGYGQKGNHPYASVIPRFIEAIKANNPIQLFGDGSQTRDFINVTDIAIAICTALFVETDYAPVINIASGTKASIKELISLIELTLGTKIEWNQHPERSGDILHSVADVTLAKEILGFSTTKTLEEGITELL